MAENLVQMCRWPEQDAVDDWWNRHRHELKELVSAYRISVERERDAAVDELNAAKDSVSYGLSLQTKLQERISRLMALEVAVRAYDALHPGKLSPAIRVSLDGLKEVPHA